MESPPSEEGGGRVFLVGRDGREYGVLGARVLKKREREDVL